MEPEAGRVLCGRYRLVRPLGKGSQASVWAAEHLALKTQVAIKLIDPEAAKRADARERFEREATAAAALRSPHVVQILDHGIDEELPFIAMELLDGEDLFDRLGRRGRLSLRDTAQILLQVARALGKAHAAGVVHRDLKPENVFLVPNDDEEVVKVLDFGVAKVSDPAKRTMQRTGVGTLIGTPHYMSPEQVKGIGEVDFRTDLWAMGVLAFQCVTGELPFDSEGVGDLLLKISVGPLPVPSERMPGLPPAFDAWFAKACERNPEARFQSARELAEALALVAGSSAEALRGAASLSREAPPTDPPAENRALFLSNAPIPLVGKAKPQRELEPQPEEGSAERPRLELLEVEVDTSEAPASPSAPDAAAGLRAPRVPSFEVDGKGERPRATPGLAPSTVSGLASSGMLSLPPPELDGARRKRRLAFGLLATAALSVAGLSLAPVSLTPPPRLTATRAALAEASARLADRALGALARRPPEALPAAPASTFSHPLAHPPAGEAPGR